MKNQKTLSEGEVVSKHRIFLRLARRMGFSFVAEDLAQDCMLALIQDPENTKDMRFYVIDALRKNFGRSGARREALFAERVDPDTVSMHKEKEALENISMRGIYRVLNRDEQDALDLCLKGYSHAEIELITGFSNYKTIRIFRKLKEAFLST